MKAVLKVITGLIILGVIGYSLNLVLPGTIVSYITKEMHMGQTIYRYDLYAYIEELKTTLSSIDVFEIEFFEREWVDIDSNIFESEFWEALVNNLAYMLDVVIFAINLILYPFRFMFWVIKFILALIGVAVNDPNLNNGLQWLIQAINFMAGLQIPFV